MKIKRHETADRKISRLICHNNRAMVSCHCIFMDDSDDDRQSEK